VGPIKAGCLTILAGAAAVIGAIYVLHRQSFCLDEWQFTTAQQKEEAAALWAFQSNNGKAESTGDIKPLAYLSLEEFHSNNPNCCRVVTDANSPNGWEKPEFGFLDYLFGFQVDAVLVKYQERMVTEQGERKDSERAVVIPISSCGRVVID
jgi:hypothetical protein